MQECAEVIAKCGRKKSQEALCVMAEDFHAIRTSMQENQNFRAADGAEDLALLPSEHPMEVTVRWSYLDQFLEAHGYLPGALIEYLHGNQKSQRQILTDLETYLANCIAD